MSLSPRIFKTALLSLLAGLFILAPLTAVQEGARPLMRFPDIHGNTVVFVYGEDIWTAPVEGGTAVRLTLHDGAEQFPKFSPDGTKIAFTGEYDGNTDVYVMNAFGGEITRVTYHPGADQVVGWHPGKNKILFSSSRSSSNRFTNLFLISPDGSGLEELILNEAFQGSFSPDGTKIAYNKVAREHRTWKRYQGGLAQEVYVYDFKTDEEKNISGFPGTDRIPMWIGETIYFTSDREGALNIFGYDTKSGEIQQLTSHEAYDVRRPSEGGDHIVYELGGELWALDVGTGETNKIPVEIRADAPEIRPYFRNVDGYITDMDASPNGKRALLVARGEIFSVPYQNGPTRNITRDCGTRDKDAVWSPDGKSVAYISDRSGEFEIYVADAMGKGDAVKLTSHRSGYRHTLRWSPDSTKLAYADQTLRCFILDVKTRKITEVDKAEYENVDVSLDLKPISDFSWSPDSRFLAYAKMDENLVYGIYIFSLETGVKRRVSEGIFNDFNPVFTTDGEHLLFISNRRFNPTYCDFEWEMVYKNTAGIYSLTLRVDGPALLPYESDEEKAEGKAAAKKEGGVKVLIDFDGLPGRIEPLPLPAGNYRQLAVNNTDLFYLNGEEGDYNRFEFRGPGPRSLYAFSFKGRRQARVMENVNAFKLSASGSHIIYRDRRGVGLISASERESKGHALDVSGLRMRIDPRREWTQIFNEAWRMERDFYYEPEMHGVDWAAMREKYGRLIPFASCRQDIQYIIGELIGELNTSHTYVYGGDQQRSGRRVNVGLLGVDWEEDAAAGRYRFKKIYATPDYSRGMIPPLMRPDIKITSGDYLLSVNGVDVTTKHNIYSYFLDTAGRQVTLTVGAGPDAENAREYTVVPAGSEGTLRYLDWVEGNRLTVDKASGGKIGYIHLPDTYLGSSVEFPKYFYAQTRKKGLIIDGRFNGGGLDPDIFLRRLDKKVLGYWTRRNSHDQTIPDLAVRAHMVCLTNRQAGSGGDMLPWEFRDKGLGPVIGTRSWGGLVGVSYFHSLVDGGGLSTPDYRIYGADGRWMIENEGVSPDIEVDLHPKEVAEGFDAQLRKGIDVLLKKIEEDPLPWPEHGSFKKDEKSKKR
jgi:tricorn protease